MKGEAQSCDVKDDAGEPGGMYHHQMGDQEVLDRYSNLVFRVARNIHEALAQSASLEDLISYGMAGLLDAHRRFDGNRQASFSTYAYYRIRGEILDGCRRSGWAFRARRTEVEDLAVLNEFLESATDAQEGQPRAKTFLDSMNYLTDLVGDAAMTMLLREVQRRNNPNPVPPQRHGIERRERLAGLFSLIEELDPNEREVIRRYYFEEETMEEISAELGYSKSWISRINARALANLREILEKDPEFSL